MLALRFRNDTGVNLADGLDGLAAGFAATVLATSVFICFFQFRNTCGNTGVAPAGCSEMRDPLDIAVIAAAALGGCIGFLWNADPARIFMGDCGSLALGGLFAGLSILTSTELLMVVVAATAVVQLLSVMLQVAAYKRRKVRLLKMAPFHHHFEITGWTETAVLVWFWLLAAVSQLWGPSCSTPSGCPRSAHSRSIPGPAPRDQ